MSDPRTRQATDFTRQANDQVLQELPFADTQAFDDARRGFVATYPGLQVPSTTGGPPLWDAPSYDFLDAEQAPETVNPSLWRLARINRNSGLFKVVDRIYQVRGFDLSNMTIVEGDTGLILIDPLMSPVMAAKGLALYREHVGDRPVVAVIYTHSHIDHYGGVKGVVDPADVAAGKIQVIAPQGFLEEAVSENVYCGNAMGRRATYQYGYLLAHDARGQVDAGLGKATAGGLTTLIPPTLEIGEQYRHLNVDGVEMEFFLAPGTEAPAEFLVWFPQFKVLDAAEDVTHTLHNLYTLRGAQVRDAKAWWKTLDAVLVRYGDQVEAVIAQHHWPVWDNDRVRALITSQRNLYKYLHDQTLHLANLGYTMAECAELLTLPDAIGKKWHNRGYYGSVNHDVKAVYQRYLGWYDSNPAHLWPLPPQEAAVRYVDFFGGADAAVAKAREYYERGDYRWVAEVMNHVVFADPGHTEARNLEADALEQLGYQAENPTWRNEFLQAAYELRHGTPRMKFVSPESPDVVTAMTPEMLLDYMGIRLDGPRAADDAVTFVWNVTDAGTSYAVELTEGVLVYTAGRRPERPDAVVDGAKLVFAEVVNGTRTLAEAVAAGDLVVTGDGTALTRVFDLLTEFEVLYPIIEP